MALRGTRLESMLTCFSNKKEEPNATSQVQNQWNGVTWALQESNDREKDLRDLPEDPGLGRICYGWVRRSCIIDCRSTDEWGCEAPTHADDEEREDIIER